MSWLMLVIETFMLDPAKLATNCVSASGTSIALGETFVAAVVSGFITRCGDVGGGSIAHHAVDGRAAAPSP
jgi:hypothetical protein